MTKVRPLFALSYRGSEISHYWSCSVLIRLTNQMWLSCDWSYFGIFHLLIWVTYMPEVTRKHNTKMTFVIFKNTVLYLKYVIWLVEIMTHMQIQNSYKVHLNTISNGELSDPLSDSVNRGLTLVRFDISINLNCLCCSTIGRDTWYFRYDSLCVPSSLFSMPLC